MSITAANAIITLGVTGVFPAPVQISGFAADDVFDVESLKKVEVLMGVDGKLSAGYVYQALVWGITLQADSASCLLFDAWDDAQTAARDTFAAFGEIVLPATGFTMALKNGYMTDYKPAPDAKRILQPRKFVITWESYGRLPL